MRHYICIIKVILQIYFFNIAEGFDKIENLEEFTCLRVIYLEGNGMLPQIQNSMSLFKGFDKIEGLNECKDLRCL